MIDIEHYHQHKLPNAEEEHSIANFLFEHLERYGDPLTDIQKAMAYALGRDQKPGGLILVAKENQTIISSVIVNKTGMSSYIPENILIYIATDKNQRGKGIGKLMMEKAIELSDGDIALHVDRDNPAIKLYERLGFTNPYLEMRLKKETK